MVLHKLNAGIKIGRVELVRDVPAKGPELSSLLHNGVKEGHRVQHGTPLGHVGNVKEVLGDTSVRAFQACFHSLGRLVGEFDGHLSYKAVNIQWNSICWNLNKGPWKSVAGSGSLR